MGVSRGRCDSREIYATQRKVPSQRTTMPGPEKKPSELTALVYYDAACRASRYVHCFSSFVIVLPPPLSVAVKVTLSPGLTALNTSPSWTLNSSPAPPELAPTV